MANPPKKILFISYDGMTDPLGQSQVIPYLKGVSRAGYRVFLLSCEKPEMYEPNRRVVEQLLHGHDIKWTPLSYTRKPPVLSTLADILKLRKAALKIHHENTLDMVHTRPGVPALVGLWLKKKTGVKFLNDIREFYADSRVEGGMWNRKNPLYNLIYHYFRKKEDEQVRKSDGIVCLTHAAEKIIRNWPSFRDTIPLEVIPCSADLALFDPSVIDDNKQKELRNEMGISREDHIVSYLGSVGGWYLTEELMRFCKILGDRDPRTKFLFISPHRHEEIVKSAARYGVPPERVITKTASRTEVPLLLSLSEYSVFFIRPCYSKQSSSPTKHGEIMAMGIPLVTNSGVGDVEEIVTKYDSGIVLYGFTDEAFQKAAEIILSLRFDRTRIRQGAKDYYSLDSAIKKYEGVYRKILG